MTPTFCFAPPPIIFTERLILHKMEDHDAEALFRLRSDPAVMQYIPRPLATSVDDAHALIDHFSKCIASNSAITWGIFSKPDETLIGTIGFVHVQPHHFRAEVGYLLATNYQRKGIMSEALKAVLHYGFSVWHFHTIEAVVSPENKPSLHLLEKSGFRQEAYFRENQFYHGRFHDSIVLTHFGQGLNFRPKHHADR